MTPKPIPLMRIEKRKKMNQEEVNQVDSFTDVSQHALLVLNYLKKHNCKIEFYWWCGIQQYKVVINGERKNYPRINEDTWYEIKPRLKRIDGEYQTGETWMLNSDYKLPYNVANAAINQH